MAEDSFEKKTSDFLAWFKAQPGTTFHEALEIRDLRSRGAGRGISEQQAIARRTNKFDIAPH